MRSVEQSYIAICVRVVFFEYGLGICPIWAMVTSRVTTKAVRKITVKMKITSRLCYFTPQWLFLERESTWFCIDQYLDLLFVNEVSRSLNSHVRFLRTIIAAAEWQKLHCFNLFMINSVLRPILIAMNCCEVFARFRKRSPYAPENCKILKITFSCLNLICFCCM